MRIFTEYSLWFVPICLLVGVGVAFLLYRNDKRLREVPRWIKITMFLLRTIVVSVLAILLLAPCLEFVKFSIKKPIIVLLHDNSSSITMRKDSAFYQNEYLSQYQQFIEKLCDKFIVEEYTFGEDVNQDSMLNFTQQATDISLAMREIPQRYHNQNLGAMVLATDGIYNVGDNPKYCLDNFPVQMPLYTLALGDTVQECDNVIAKVLNNRVAFRNTPFAVEITTESHALKGKPSKLTVFDGKRQVFQTQIVAKSESETNVVHCRLQTEEVGKKIFTVTLEYHQGEIDEQNNTYSFAVDILENRKKVVVLFAASHPDVAAICRAIETNKNYECSSACITDPNLPDIRDANCLVLLGLPNTIGKGKTILNEAISLGIPSFVVYNKTLSPYVLSFENLGVTFTQVRSDFEEVAVEVQADNSLFSFEETTKKLFETAPPLLVPYGEFEFSAQTNVSLWQKIDGFQKNSPLLSVSQIQGTKVAVFWGEGLWRWRLFDFKQNESFAAFDSFINKIVGYLALTEKRDRLMILHNDIYTENQSIQFSAELYDQSFEPIPDRNISLTISNEQGREYPFTFVPKQNFYALSAGKLPKGTYKFSAKAQFNDETLVKNGSFFVLPLQLESKRTAANHALLREIASQTNAKMFYANEFGKLYDEITSNKNIVSVSYKNRERSFLIDLPLILILVIAMASAEWFLRKYYATY